MHDQHDILIMTECIKSCFRCINYYFS